MAIWSKYKVTRAYLRGMEYRKNKHAPKPFYISILGRFGCLLGILYRNGGKDPHGAK